MSSTCSSCASTIQESVPRAICTECNCAYHFGQCAGVKEKSFQAKPPDSKKTWRCCKCRAGKAPVTGKEENGSDSESDIRKTLAAILGKLESLPELTKKVDQIEQSVQHMSKKFDDFERQVSRQENEIKALKKRVAELEEKDDMTQVVQAQLQQDVNDLENRSRKLNLEIHGIPFQPDENLLSVLNSLAPKLEVPLLTATDIQTIHRLPARKDKKPGIIARFTRQATRDTWLSAKNKVKENDPPIVIQENLTRYNRELLRRVKDWAKGNGYLYVWHVNGKVLVRKSAGMDAIHIKGEDDLEQLK